MPDLHVGLENMKIEHILKRLIYGIVGLILGLFAGGIVAYLIALFVTPKGKDPALIFVLTFALITSQAGMILGPYLTDRFIKKEE